MNIIKYGDENAKTKQCTYACNPTEFMRRFSMTLNCCVCLFFRGEIKFPRPTSIENTFLNNISICVILFLNLDRGLGRRRTRIFSTLVLNIISLNLHCSNELFSIIIKYTNINIIIILNGNFTFVWQLII